MLSEMICVFTCVRSCTMCELLQHFVQPVKRRPASLGAVQGPRLAAVVATVIMVIVVPIMLPIMVFIVMMAVMVNFIILVITVVRVAVGDGCCVMQQLLFKGGDLPLQQLF